MNWCFFSFFKWAWDLPTNNITFYSIHLLSWSPWFDRRNFSWLRFGSLLFISVLISCVALFFYSFDVESNMYNNNEGKLSFAEKPTLTHFNFPSVHISQVQIYYNTLKLQFCSDVLFSSFLSCTLYMEKQKRKLAFSKCQQYLHI